MWEISFLIYILHRTGSVNEEKQIDNSLNIKKVDRTFFVLYRERKNFENKTSRSRTTMYANVMVIIHGHTKAG